MFRAHAEFKSGFQTNNSSHEIFYVMLLFDNGGVELLDLIGKFNRGSKGVPHPFCPPRAYPLREAALASCWIRCSDSAIRLSV